MKLMKLFLTSLCGLIITCTTTFGMDTPKKFTILSNDGQEITLASKTITTKINGNYLSPVLFNAFTQGFKEQECSCIKCELADAETLSLFISLLEIMYDQGMNGTPLNEHYPHQLSTYIFNDLVNGNMNVIITLYKLADYYEVALLRAACEEILCLPETIAHFITNADAYKTLLDDAMRTKLITIKTPHRYALAQAIIDDPHRNINCVRFSPDGALFASGSKDCTIKIWTLNKETATYQIQQTIDHIIHGNLTCVGTLAFSPDGHMLASSSSGCRANRAIMLWSFNQDTHQFELTQTIDSTTPGFHTDDVNSITFSPDGNNFASASYDATVKIWDFNPATRQFEISQTIDRTTHGHPHNVTDIAFSPDGNHLASASCDETVKIWTFNPATHQFELTDTFDHNIWPEIGNPVLCVAFSADGHYLISGSDIIKIWQLDTTTQRFTPLQTITHTNGGHTDCIRDIIFSTDNQKIISCSNDCTIKLWSLDPETQLFQLNDTIPAHDAQVTSIAISPDEQYIISGAQEPFYTAKDQATLKIWRKEPSCSTATILQAMFLKAIETTEHDLDLQTATPSNNALCSIAASFIGTPLDAYIKNHVRMNPEKALIHAGIAYAKSQQQKTLPRTTSTQKKLEHYLKNKPLNNYREKM